jgi:predicted dehydrogenase
MSQDTLRIGVVGGGMFFDDIIGPALRDFQRGGFAGALTSIGMSHFAPRTAAIKVEFAAIGTRTRKKGTADAIRNDFLNEFPDADLTSHYGDTVWREMITDRNLDILVVAGPDDMHHTAILDALGAGLHVITEKPMCLHTAEADAVVAAAERAGRIVAVDMHKRYDPFIRDMMTNSLPAYNRIHRVRAVLEEPLEVATETFAWVERSNPFAYVGCHWLDVIGHYMDVKPRAIYATGEKMLLENWDRYRYEIAILRGQNPDDAKRHDKIHAWDSLNVNITYDNGMRGDFNNTWINPADFEGAVNQELEVYGVLGRGLVDQQDRGFREAVTGAGSRTKNPTFGGRIRNMGHHAELFGYGKASLAAGLLAIARVKFLGEPARGLAGSYPEAASQRSVTMIIEAATRVAELNYEHFQERGVAPVTAALTDDTITILDPFGPAGGTVIYQRSNA